MTEYQKQGKEALEKFRWNTQNAIKVQKELLQKILFHNQETLIGKNYSFSTIKSAEDYQKYVPLSTYQDYADAILEMMAGKKNGLTKEPAIFYCLSSGSTGVPKYIPLTESDIMSHYLYAYLAIYGVVSEYFNTFGEKELFGHIFQISENVKTFLPDGTMQGIRSSSLYQWMDQDNTFDISDYCAPREVIFPNLLEDILYVQVRFALAERDITCIHGVFVNRLAMLFKYLEKNWEMLLRDLENGTVDESVELSQEWRQYLSRHLPKDPIRASELYAIHPDKLGEGMVKKIWPNIKYAMFIGGQMFSEYDRQIESYIKGVPIHYFAYAASEGIFGIAPEMNVRDTYVLIPDSGFFEFIEEGDKTEKIHTIESLKAGVKYELIFTNQSGFYRYRMEDIVEIIDFFGQAPIVKICYRKNQILNVADERMYIEQFDKSIIKFEELIGSKMSNYCVMEDFSVSPPRYLFFAAAEQIFTEDFAKKLDKCLQEENYSYMRERKLRGISSLEIVQLSENSFLRYWDFLKEKGYPIGQSKPLCILAAQEQKQFFMQEMRCGKI